MSWESTAVYYRALNELVKKKLGNLHSAEIAMVSVDFEPVERLQHQGEWDQIAGMLAAQAKKVEAAGAAGRERIELRPARGGRAHDDAQGGAADRKCIGYPCSPHS